MALARAHLVRIGADDAARNSTACSDQATKRVNHGSVPAMLARILGICLDDLGIGRLQVLSNRTTNISNLLHEGYGPENTSLLGG
jgi:hypothetical protein